MSRRFIRTQTIFFFFRELEKIRKKKSFIFGNFILINRKQKRKHVLLFVCEFFAFNTFGSLTST